MFRLVAKRLAVGARCLVVAALLVVAGVGAAVGGDGLAAYANGDYATAYRLLLPLAEGGDVAAQATLGAMYWGGQGRARDAAEAARWFALAGEQGHGQSQAILGFMYLEGTGVPRDAVQAYVWLTLATSSLSPGETFYKALRERDAVARGLTGEQLRRAGELTREWWARHPR